LTIKREILQEQLERFGGFTGLNINETVPSSRELAYRNHVQFHLDSNGKPGFQRALSHEVVAVDKCLIVEDTINVLLKTLNFDPETGVERVAIRDDGHGTPLVFLNGSTNNPPEFEIDFPLNVVYRSPAGDIPLSGECFNQFTIWEKEFQVSAGSFFQTNNDMAEKMAKIVSDMAGPEKRETILDCYCGVGFFSRFLVERAGRLIGIESSEDACNDFAVNLDEFDNVELYQGNVEAVLPELDTHPDLVIIDPPRAGIAPAGMKALLKSKPGQIIYISCDPSTLARDLKIMVASGYSIESITPIDMFPQTYHIESITNLMRK
jgi:23S rRNA (uracil1939-C5)-methyltransferase